jgi:hypothetical protein
MVIPYFTTKEEEADQRGRFGAHDPPRLSRCRAA